MAKKKEDVKEAEASKQKFATPEKSSFSEAKAVVQSPDYNAKAVRGVKCISCNVSIVNDPGAVKFSCPNCGQYKIIRCSKCRKIVSKYKCPLCGFEGPN